MERQEGLFDKWLLQHTEFVASNLKAVDRGLSAFKGDHKSAGLGDLLKAIEEGKIVAGDAIVIEAIDRITREQASSALHCITGIVRSGVKIYTIEDDACYDINSLQSVALHVLVAKIHASYEYSKRLSLRVKGAYESKKAKARAGEFVKSPNRPFWIDTEGKVKNGESQLVLRAIELYRAGAGQLGILKRLQQEFPFSPNVPNTTRTIKRWLISEALIGQWRGIQTFEPLLDLHEYWSLSQLVQQRTIHSKPEEQYLLSGLIRCGDCGGAYNFRRQKPRATVNAPLNSEAYLAKGDIVYANCASFLKSSRCNNSFTVPYEVAELIFDRTTDSILYSIAAEKAVNALSAKEIGELLARKQILLQRIERLSKLYRVTGQQTDLDEIAQCKVELDGLIAKIDAEEKLQSDLQEIANSNMVVRESDFEDGTQSQIQFHNEIQKVYTELTGNIINFRNALKEYGYAITASRSELEGSNGVLRIFANEYKISRRSQKRGCYVVLAYEPNDFGQMETVELYASRKKLVLQGPSNAQN